jgi:L-alanine-DL-glutamate epimerase-like enolase superfamily enzyme
MKITGIETFVLHVPVTRGGVADAVHTLTHWGAPGVIIRTDAGIDGYGYLGTHADLASDKLIAAFIADCYAPLLIGQDPTNVTALWTKLFRHPPLQWVGRAGISHLALGAVDIALWDIKAKAAGQPLWQVLGGSANRTVTAYNTDGGWLNWSHDQLIADALEATGGRGFKAIKIKVGHENPSTDVRRVAAVRKAIDPDIRIMCDANGRWDLPTAERFAEGCRDLDLVWFEEPIWYDDIEGHRRLAAKSPVPIALGEQLYTAEHFAAFVARDAVHYLQPDVTRLAGVTEFMRVAELGAANALPVVAHAGDMMHVHHHLSFAHQAIKLFEYIPWMLDVFEEPTRVENGLLVAPRQPGAGSTVSAHGMRTYRVA